MIKRVVSVLLAVLCFAIGSLASAGSFTDLGRYRLNNLADNQDVVREFNTQNGVIKIIFRKAPFNVPEARYRMMLFKGEQMFFNCYWPEEKGQFELVVLEDKESSRCYVALETGDRTRVLGFDENQLTVKGYIDSKKLDSKGESGPKVYVSRNNDFEMVYTVPNNHRGQNYRFNWNAQTQSFDVADLSELRRQQEAAEAARIRAEQEAAEAAAAAASQSTTPSTGYYTSSYESSYEEPSYVDFGGDVVDF